MAATAGGVAVGSAVGHVAGHALTGMFRWLAQFQLRKKIKKPRNQRCSLLKKNIWEHLPVLRC